MKDKEKRENESSITKGHDEFKPAGSSQNVQHITKLRLQCNQQANLVSKKGGNYKADRNRSEYEEVRRLMVIDKHITTTYQHKNLVESPGV